MKPSSIREIFSKISTPLKISIIALVGMLIVSIIFFVRGITEVRHGGMRPHNPLGIILSGSRQPPQKLGIGDVDTIDVWMTFSYINFSYDLPKNLLQDSLRIETPKYPEVSLQSYIRKQKLDKTSFLQKVKEVVRTSLKNSVK